MEIESDVISNRNAKANPNDWLSNLSSDMRKNLFHIANRSGPIDVFILVWQSSWWYYTRWPTLISNKYPRNNKSEVATTTPRTSKYRTSKSLVDDADDVDVPAPFTYFAKKSNKKQTKKSNKKKTEQKLVFRVLNIIQFRDTTETSYAFRNPIQPDGFIIKQQ